MSPDQDSLLLWLAAIFLFLLISAFFSASETALTALSRARMYQLMMDGNKRARLVSKMRKDKESMIGAILIGNNAVNIAASALATSISIQLFHENSLLIVTGVMTALVVVFCEILPKTYAIHNAERASLALSPALYIIVKILAPVSRLIQLFIKLIFRIVGIDVTRPNTLVSATDVIRGTIELHLREGTMIKQDRDMLGSILDLNDVDVRHITIHRKQVDAIDADLDADVIVRQAVGILHSRIPLWQGEPDNLIGILHVKDLIKALNDNRMTLTREQILALLDKPWFIPETTSLRDQLLAFRAKRKHIACVIDEYGGWQGIVTLEDIIEEIVGNIEDEHDEITAGHVKKTGENIYIVNGGVSIRDLNRQLDWNLPDEEATTVAGLVLNETRSIPAKGHEFDAHGFRFTVMEKSATQIKRVKLEKLLRPEGEEDEGMV